jgi:hypothetical protein
MGIGVTIFWDSLRHAWRFKVPTVFFLLIILTVAALPRLTAGDGSLEGQVRLYLLYGGQLCTFGLSLFGVAYTIWFEHQERNLGVHLLLHTQPIRPSTLIFWRICAYLTLIFIIITLNGFTMAMVSKSMIDRHNDTNEAKLLSARLFEVRGREALEPNFEYNNQQKRLEKKQQTVIPLEMGQFYEFKIPALSKLNRPVLEGRLLALGKAKDLVIRLALRHNKRIIWARELPSSISKTFSVVLPLALSKLSNATLTISQVNSSKSALYLPNSSPLSITQPKGSWWGNVLKSSLMLTCLLGTLVTLSMFAAQLLSSQGSLLLMFLIYLVGSFKPDIEKLLFPVPPMIEGLAIQPTPFGISEVITAAIWRPLLWLIPNFQDLNPTDSLINGEFISWSTIGYNSAAALPLVAICGFYLAYFLPKRERAVER